MHHPYWALTGQTSLMASTVEWKPQSIQIRLGRFGRKFRKSSSYKSMVSMVLFPSLSRYSSPKKSAFPSLLFFPWADNLSWARLVIPWSCLLIPCQERTRSAIYRSGWFFLTFDSQRKASTVSIHHNNRSGACEVLSLPPGIFVFFVNIYGQNFSGRNVFVYL